MSESDAIPTLEHHYWTDETGADRCTSTAGPAWDPPDGPKEWYLTPDQRAFTDTHPVEFDPVHDASYSPIDGRQLGGFDYPYHLGVSSHQAFVNLPQAEQGALIQGQIGAALSAAEQRYHRETGAPQYYQTLSGDWRREGGEAYQYPPRRSGGLLATLGGVLRLIFGIKDTSQPDDFARYHAAHQRCEADRIARQTAEMSMENCQYCGAPMPENYCWDCWQRANERRSA